MKAPSARPRGRQEFGGRIQWEAVCFGLLAAIGLAASLLVMVLGGLVATGVTSRRLRHRQEASA